jgi:hypothetical protein
MHFNFQGNIYEQIKGVAMGSPLSPIVVYLYMEWFQNKSIESHCFNPKHWKVFIDDTYIVWPHGKEILHRFKGHLNNEVESIGFTMGMEDNNNILFLDILIYKKNDGSLSHQVYRKKTHTNRYLHIDSHHHLAQKLDIINKLVI